MIEQPGQFDPQAQDKGRAAFDAGKQSWENPYPVGRRPWSRRLWGDAWTSAQREAVEAAIREGGAAFAEGAELDANPYGDPNQPSLTSAWSQGWNAAADRENAASANEAPAFPAQNSKRSRRRPPRK